VRMGATIFIAGLIGGVWSRYVSQQVLLLIFGLLALVAAILMLRPKPVKNETPLPENLSFSYWRSTLTAAGVGILGGLVGQGGSFILIPLMITFVQIPTRLAIGSNLAIVLLSTTAGFLGKAATGQIEWLLTIPIILTVVPAAQLGGILSHRVDVIKLRMILGIVIAGVTVRILFSVFSG